MDLVLKYYLRKDNYWIRTELFKYSFKNLDNNPLKKELINIVEKLANSDVLAIEELQKDSSLRFSIVIDAINLYTEYGRYNAKRKVVKIAETYEDKILELSKNRNLTKNLDKSRKKLLREIKERLDPTNNIDKIRFENYNNPLAMIAFINGHISSEKRLTQKRSTAILDFCFLYDCMTKELSRKPKSGNFSFGSLSNFVPYLRQRLLRRKAWLTYSFWNHFPKRIPDLFMGGW